MTPSPKPTKKKTKEKKLIKIGTLKRNIQSLVNSYIRKRDSKDGYFTCISCGVVKPIDQLNAGHYIPVSKSQFLRFNDLNINGECIRCNCFSEYHLIPYRRNLIEKIGLEGVQWLERQAEEVKIHKYTRQELTEVENYYKSLIK